MSTCYSLHAVWISNSIIHALQISARAVPLSFVYYHPNINSLSQFTFNLAHGNITADEQLVSRVEKMKQFVQHFSDGLPCHTEHHSCPCSGGQSDTIIITGSTGALGSSVLSKLVASDSVSHVYALNRITNCDTPLVDRQRNALAKRGLDPGVATSSKVSLLEVNFNSYRLGLGEEQFEEVSRHYLRFWETFDHCLTLAKSFDHTYHPPWYVLLNLIWNIIYDLLTYF